MNFLTTIPKTIWGVLLIIIATLIASLLTSCATQQNCRTKYPCDQLVRIETKDTIIYTQHTKIDSLWVFSTDTLTDTLTLEKEKLKIQLIKYRDTVRIYAECKPDTVTITKEIKTYKLAPPIERKKTWWQTTQLVATLILLFLIIGAIAGFLIKFFVR